jgi:aminopeptidase N
MCRRLVAIALLAASVTRAQEVAPAGPLPDTVIPTHYRVSLSIDPRQTNFSGRVDIDTTVRAPLHTIWLHGLGLHVSSVTVTSAGHVSKGRYEEIDHDSGVARIVTDAAVAAGKATLHLRYTAAFQSAPQGLYRTQAGKDWYAFSQMEAIDGRRVFPGFDEPRFKTPFEVTLVTTGDDRAVTNTPETHATRLKSGTTQHKYLLTKPLPTYLLAFAVGPLEILEGAPIPPNSVRHAPLPLRLVGTSQADAARFKFALAQAPDIIARLENYFGIAFPYPKIDLIASPIHGGAMENAGAIIFEEDLLAFAHEPTPRQQANFGVVAAHELAHQWFGDLVTPAWWDDIWLNEAFAEWMGSKISDQWRPQLGLEKEQLDSTINAMTTDALKAGRPIHQRVTRNSEIGATFDNITYDKGAGVIGMVESYLGPERFQRGVQLHLNRHAHGTATAGQFFAAMAEASGEPAIIQAFQSFVDQPGLPIVAVRRGADGALQLEQSRYRPLGSGTAGGESPPWQIPFCAAFYVGGLPTKQCTMLTAHSGTLTVAEPLRAAVVHPNANGAGYYRFALDGELLPPLLAMGVRLPAREAMTLADSVGAAFAAGRLSFAQLYETARVLAAHPDRTASLSLGYQLENLHDHLANSADRPLLEGALVSLYGERLQKLGYDTTPGHYSAEPAEQQLLRRQLIGLVGLTGRSAEVRSAMASAADRSAQNPEAVEPLLRWRIWAIGLQERGAPLLVALKKLAIDSPDAQVRADAGTALGYAGAAVSSDVLETSLNPRLEMGLATRIVFQQMADPNTRETTWMWLGAHRDAALARVPAMFQSFYAEVGSAFCSTEGRHSFNTVLGERLRSTSGGEVQVDRALEGIDDCVALRAAVGDSIRRTLQKQ